MPTTTPLTDAIQALTTYANETTGASDTTLSAAVGTLVAGYGGGGGSDANFVDATEGDITRVDNSEITHLRNGAFANCGSLAYVNLPNVVTGQHNAFNACSSLIEAHLPKWAANVGNSAFNGCGNLVTLEAPLITGCGNDAFSYAPLTNTHILKSFATGGQRAFRNAKFTVFVLPSLNSAQTNLFLTCNLIETVDIGPNLKSIPSQMLNGNDVLENIIFRSSTLVTLSNANGLWGNTNAPSVNKKIWVPSGLISSYQTASNWSTLYNNGYISFHAIEGSNYETQYADGTPIE